MAFNLNDLKLLDKKIEKITTTDVHQISVNEGVPATDQLEDNNKVYSTEATILFIDIRKSTVLTDMSQPKSMVKIYRSFMRMAVDCVRKNNGVTRQFLGDRIMGVFVDVKNEDGDVVLSAIDNAINAARSLQTVIDFCLNKYLKSNVSGKIIDCGIGIDCGSILVTKVGMYGTEVDEQKDDEMSCVWVGRITNYASKFSDMAKGSEILISENVYKGLSNSLKENNRWNRVVRVKNNMTINGYSTFNYYLDFTNELGNPIKKSNEQQSENEVQLSALVDKLQDSINQNVVLKRKIEDEKQTLEKSAQNAYTIHSNFLSDTVMYRKELINMYGVEFWNKWIDDLYSTGKMCGYSSERVTSDNNYSLINLYDNLGLYEKAYDVTLEMARKQIWWIPIRENTIKWAEKNYRLWALEEQIEDRIKKETSDSIKQDWIEIQKEVADILEVK